MSRIQHNMSAMNTHRMYTINNSAAAKSAEKLSSGYRINRAGDDAAGLAISEKMRSQIRGLNMASKNSQDGISLIQTAEGALQEVHSMLQRMSELATQSATGTNENFDRTQISAEFEQLKAEIDDIAEQTTFNNMKLFDGSLGGGNSKVTDLGKSIGQALGTAGTGFAGGVVTNAIVTDWKGVSSDKVGSVTFDIGTYDAAGAWNTAAGGTDGDVVRFTFTGADGLPSTVERKWSEVFTNTTTNVNGGGLAANDRGTLDLSAAGLGKIEIVGTAAVAATALQTGFLEATGNTVALEVGPGGAGNGGAVKIQVGANEGEQLEISIKSMSATGLNISGLTISDQTSAGAAITGIKEAINTVSEQRASLGAMQNRLDHKIKNLDNSSENLQSAEASIRDVDMASEMTEYQKQNILTQAATAMLAQANAAPQNVLQLLG